jgi:hypothetical protein
VEESGIPELTTEQIENLCTVAEKAAKKHVLSKVPLKMVDRLNISVEADGAKQLNLTVEVDVVLSSEMKDYSLSRLAGEAAKEALRVSENYLRSIK